MIMINNIYLCMKITVAIVNSIIINTLEKQCKQY